MGKKCASSTKILLLLADGFSEVQATLYISELREAGLPLKTLGLTKQLVRSEHGVEILPDLSIDAVIRTALPIQLLILPGGKTLASAWRADPRTRLLLDLVWKQGGCLLAAPELIDVLESILHPDLSLNVCRELPVAHTMPSPAIPVLVTPMDYKAAPIAFLQMLVTACLD